MASATAALVLVGWDDVKCRPIFRKNVPPEEERGRRRRAGGGGGTVVARRRRGAKKKCRARAASVDVDDDGSIPRVGGGGIRSASSASSSDRRASRGAASPSSPARAVVVVEREAGRGVAVVVVADEGGGRAPTILPSLAAAVERPRGSSGARFVVSRAGRRRKSYGSAGAHGAATVPRPPFVGRSGRDDSAGRPVPPKGGNDEDEVAAAAVSSSLRRNPPPGEATGGGAEPEGSEGGGGGAGTHRGEWARSRPRPEKEVGGGGVSAFAGAKRRTRGRVAESSGVPAVSAPGLLPGRGGRDDDDGDDDDDDDDGTAEPPPREGSGAGAEVGRSDEGEDDDGRAPPEREEQSGFNDNDGRSERSPMRGGGLDGGPAPSVDCADGDAPARPTDEKNTKGIAPARRGSPRGPNSNVDFDGRTDAEVPVRRRGSSPPGVGPDDGPVENVLSRNSARADVPVAGSSARGRRSPPISIDARRAIGTPDGGGIVRRRSDERDPPRSSPRTDTPSTKGDESTFCPGSSGAKPSYSDADAFEDYGVTFDEPKEPHAQCGKRRRSYGDVKPVWTSNKFAAAVVAAAAPAVPGEVGWDDAKCRPIYGVPPPARNAPSRDGPRDDDSPAADDGGGDPRTRTRRTTKRRAYASLFKKTGLSRAARDKMEIDSPFGVARSPPAPPSAARGGRRVPTPSAETLGRADGDGTKEESAVDDVDRPDPRDARPRNLPPPLDVDLEMEAIAYDGNARRSQPTSGTSLGLARAFFRYLDDNHDLTVLDRGDESPRAAPRAGVVRTERRTEATGRLRFQYSEYCRTVRDAGVDPISLGEFARNRDLYFTAERGAFGDGMLDED